MKQKVFTKVKEIIKKENLNINLNQNEDNIIKEFQNRVNWYLISYCQKLSEPFIREFQNKVDWHWISTNQILSEPFIREFQNKVNWVEINKNKKISKSPEFQDIINQELLVEELKK